MDPKEAQFRTVEAQLDHAVSSAVAALRARGIDVADGSWRSYHYKVSHLRWAYAFSRTWELELETADVSVEFSYMELVVSGEPDEVFITAHAEKYRPGKESSISQRSTRSLEFRELIQRGIAVVALAELTQVAKAVGQEL